jgi:hypothetical protein
VSQFARAHPELPDDAQLTRAIDAYDRQDGPKPACPFCHLRSCLLGIDPCDESKRTRPRC